MDDLDRKLAARLTNDARASWAELGAELGLSPPAVADRAKRLSERGIIRGYHAVLDPAALGYTLTAFVAVTLTHPRDRAKFLAVVAKREEIRKRTTWPATTTSCSRSTAAIRSIWNTF